MFRSQKGEEAEEKTRVTPPDIDESEEIGGAGLVERERERGGRGRLILESFNTEERGAPADNERENEDGKR